MAPDRADLNVKGIYAKNITLKMALLYLNQLFESYSSFEAKLIEYENTQNCLFVKSDSCRNLNTASMKEFPYKYLVMSCKQGRGRSPESCGERPNQRYMYDLFSNLKKSHLA